MLLISSFLACSCNAQNNNISTVTIINQSSEDIENGEIKMCGQSFDLPGLSLHEKFEISYKNFSDCHYLISIKFSSGKEIEEEIGYITSGVTLKDRILVGDATFSIERKVEKD